MATLQAQAAHPIWKAPPECMIPQPSLSAEAQAYRAYNRLTARRQEKEELFQRANDLLIEEQELNEYIQAYAERTDSVWV